MREIAIATVIIALILFAWRSPDPDKQTLSMPDVGTESQKAGK